MNSESCIYHSGTSVNTVTALGLSQQPLHLFEQTGSRSLLKAEENKHIMFKFPTEPI